MAVTSEHQLFHRLTKRQPAQRSILIPLPSSVFISLWQFISHIPSLRHSSRAKLTRHDFATFSIALANLLAKFTPILFSAIPFRNTITWKMHEACTWISIALLCYMLLVLLATSSFSWSSVSIQRLKFRLLWWTGSRNRAKHVPANEKKNNNLEKSGTSVNDMPVGPPNTIAAYMCYICDTEMLRDFGEGLENVGQRERDKLVIAMGKEYVFGEMVGAVSGRTRAGVDYAKNLRDAASQGRRTARS